MRSPLTDHDYPERTRAWLAEIERICGGKAGYIWAPTSSGRWHAFEVRQLDEMELAAVRRGELRLRVMSYCGAAKPLPQSPNAPLPGQPYCRRCAKYLSLRPLLRPPIYHAMRRFESELREWLHERIPEKVRSWPRAAEFVRDAEAALSTAMLLAEQVGYADRETLQPAATEWATRWLIAKLAYDRSHNEEM